MAVLRIAKLSNGEIVLVIKSAQSVGFSEYKHVLVNDNINARRERFDPYWVIETCVVWYMEWRV